MDQKTLSFAVRNEIKKGPVKRLRKTGKIPSVIYGRRKPVLISIDEHEFHNKFKTISESTIIILKSEASSHEVLVKDYQEDYMNEKIIHIDFYEIEKGKLLKTHVPVHLNGTPDGVKEGGLLEYLIHELEVECLPERLPDEFAINVEELVIGQSIHVSDVEEIEGVKILVPPDYVICTIGVKKKVEEEEEAEGEEITEELETEEATAED